MVRVCSALRVIGTVAVLGGMAAPPAFADQIGVAFVTCINPTSAAGCQSLTSGQVWWRVWNRFDPAVGGDLANPFPGSNDLHDVRLDFDFAGGTRSWFWDVITPEGRFAETEPFDVSLIHGFIALRITATLTRTVFDPLWVSNEYLSFIADTPFLSASTNSFPPPLDLTAEGRFVLSPVPEPATLSLLVIGIAGIRGARWVRRRRS